MGFFSVFFYFSLNDINELLTDPYPLKVRANDFFYFLLLFSSSSFFSTCTFKASCYSIRLSWVHTPVINWAVCLEGRKEMFYLTTHSTHFILRLYVVGHTVKDRSDNERGNPLPPHGLLFPIDSKGSFICTIPQTG